MIIQVTLLITRIFPLLLLIIGMGMTGIWIADILKGKFKSQGNFFNWIEGENRLWPHILAEMLTGILAIVSGIAMFLAWSWATELTLFALGAIVYSCINSTGWVVHKKERFAYGIPIWISLGLALFMIIWLI